MKLFVLYLVVIGGIVAVLTLKLVRRFYSFSGRRISLRDIGDSSIDPDLFVDLALANKIECEVPANSGTPSLGATKEISLQRLRLAHSKFLLIWERCYAD